MSLDYLGSLSLAVALPGADGAAVAGEAGINGALPDIEARLDAMADFAPVDVDFAADLSFANDTVSAITLAIGTPGITPPSLGDQITIMAGIVADLTAAVSAVNANLAIVTGFISLLATAGVFGYAYAGPANGLGGALTTELASGFPGGSPTDSTHAIVLATTTPATWTAMQAVFKTTP
jgi:hypothetical protein